MSFLMTPCHFIGTEDKCQEHQSTDGRRCWHLRFEEFCDSRPIQDAIQDKTMAAYDTLWAWRQRRMIVGAS
jgi:hypothetical protein